MALVENLRAFFDPLFAVTAVINDSAAVTGIFNIADMDEMDVCGENPRFLCVQADLEEGTGVDDEIVISDVSYRIAEVLPDGSGLVEFVLEKKS